MELLCEGHRCAVDETATNELSIGFDTGQYTWRPANPGQFSKAVPAHTSLSCYKNVDVEIFFTFPYKSTISDDPSRSIFWGHTLEEVYNKKMGTFKPEEPVSDKVSAVGLRMTGSPLSMFLYSKERIQSSYRSCFR